MDCLICLEHFDSHFHKPMVLECGHTFCITCIKSIYQRPSAECPLDRSKLTKPLSKVTVNYTVQDIISSFASISLSSPSKNQESASSNQSNPQILPNQVANFPFNVSVPVPNHPYSTVKCPANHVLTEYADLRSRLTSAGRPLTSNIFCDFCRTSNFKKIFSCLICSFDLCQLCIEEQFSCERLKSDYAILCDKAHELFYYKNTSGFYARMANSGAIRCDYCNVCWQGASWACRLCKFDLCNACVDKSQLGFRLHCNKKHLLQTIRPGFVTGNSFVCTVCKIVSPAQGFCCLPCRFNMCTNCADYFTRSEYLPFTCPEGHELVNSEDQVSVYFMRSSVRSFACNGCRKVFAYPKNFHCRRCDFDLCVDCYSTIVNGVSNGLRVRCTQNHELLWCSDALKSYRSNIRCNICRRVYNKCGSFHCTACKFDVCLICASNLIQQ